MAGVADPLAEWSARCTSLAHYPRLRLAVASVGMNSSASGTTASVLPRAPPGAPGSAGGAHGAGRFHRGDAALCLLLEGDVHTRTGSGRPSPSARPGAQTDSSIPAQLRRPARGRSKGTWCGRYARLSTNCLKRRGWLARIKACTHTRRFVIRWPCASVSSTSRRSGRSRAGQAHGAYHCTGW